MALEKKFTAFLNESRFGLTTNEKIVSMILFMESDVFQKMEFMTESKLDEDLKILSEGINDHLNKLGLKIHKSKGILDYIKSFTTGIGKVMFHIVKGDVDKAKELIKSVSKEDVMDFLYKLDLGTLHLFTGPIHMIDAWTGWDLAVNLKSHMEKGEGISDMIKKELTKVKEYITKLFSSDEDKQKELNNYVDNILGTIV